MCGNHMVSEASAPRFVFRSRASPACASECVKMQFHVQREEPETAILTVDSRVFDVCAQNSMCAINNVCEGTVVGCQPRTIC
jgi:hypothetical protein